MKFGVLKSKIEQHLLECYSTGTFKNELKIFNVLVLENKNVSRLYNLYDELTKNKGFDKTYSEEYLKESSEIYTKNQLDDSTYETINWWVNDVVCENNYSDLDTFFTKDESSIENILESKRRILETLTKKEVVVEHIDIPIQDMVTISNETIKNYLNSIDEGTRNEVKKLLSLTEDELTMRFNVLSEMTIEKLENIKDETNKEKIDEVISKIMNEDINHISYVKLKELNNSI